MWESRIPLFIRIQISSMTLFISVIIIVVSKMIRYNIKVSEGSEMFQHDQDESNDDEETIKPQKQKRKKRKRKERY